MAGVNGTQGNTPTLVVQQLPNGHIGFAGNIRDPLMMALILGQAVVELAMGMAHLRQAEAQHTIVGPDGQLPTVPKGG